MPGGCVDGHQGEQRHHAELRERRRRDRLEQGDVVRADAEQPLGDLVPLEHEQQQRQAPGPC